jgi:hypothetical protein
MHRARYSNFFLFFFYFVFYFKNEKYLDLQKRCNVIYTDLIVKKSKEKITRTQETTGQRVARVKQEVWPVVFSFTRTHTCMCKHRRAERNKRNRLESRSVVSYTHIRVEAFCEFEQYNLHIGTASERKKNSKTKK